MRKKIFFIILPLLFCLNMLVVPTASAQEAFPGIYSFAGCTGLDCSACNVVDMVNGGLVWLIGILFILFAVLMTIAGVKLVTSAGNPSALNAAKSSFINAIVGMIIILSAWLIVDTIMRGLVGGPGNEGDIGIIQGGEVTGWLAWSDVECQVMAVPEYEEVPDFTASGANSYQAYVLNSADNCKIVSNASFPDIAMCQTALSSVLASGQSYVVQDCSGNLGAGAVPSWSTLAICGGGLAGPIGTGNEAIVAYAEQMRAQSCQYSQPLRNGCTGSPGYTDCSNLVDISYRAAGCNSPGPTTAYQIGEAVSIGNPADLRPGDSLIYRQGEKGHVVICRDVGCSSVIHAKGQAYGIVISTGSSYYNDPKYRVIRASSMCP